MSEPIKPCPCGHAPKALSVTEGSTFRWRYVEADCGCGWQIEARVHTIPPEGYDEYADCIDSWNKMPRIDDEWK